MSLQPHGGTLVNRFLAAEEAVRILEAAAGMPCLRVDAYTAFDIDCIAKGIFSPLEGFMTSAQVKSVLETMTIRPGRSSIWSVVAASQRTRPASGRASVVSMDWSANSRTGFPGGRCTAMRPMR